MTDRDSAPAQSPGDNPHNPRHPEIELNLAEMTDKPVAMVSVVRRALQKAGHHTAAAEVTERGLRASPEELLDVCRSFVTDVSS